MCSVRLHIVLAVGVVRAMLVVLVWMLLAVVIYLRYYCITTIVGSVYIHGFSTLWKYGINGHLKGQVAKPRFFVVCAINKALIIIFIIIYIDYFLLVLLSLLLFIIAIFIIIYYNYLYYYYYLYIIYYYFTLYVYIIITIIGCHTFL